MSSRRPQCPPLVHMKLAFAMKPLISLSCAEPLHRSTDHCNVYCIPPRGAMRSQRTGTIDLSLTVYPL